MKRKREFVPRMDLSMFESIDVKIRILKEMGRKRMESLTKRNYLMAAKITLVCSVILLMILIFLSIKNIYVQLGMPTGGISHQFLSGLCVISIILSANYLINYRIKDKVIKGVVTGVGVFLLLLMIFINWIPSSNAKFTTFTSPDKKEVFVIKETGYGQLYQLSNSKFFMIHLVDIRTNNGYKPFSNHTYKLEWDSPDKLTILYVSDYMQPDNYEKISVSYQLN